MGQLLLQRTSGRLTNEVNAMIEQAEKMKLQVSEQAGGSLWQDQVQSQRRESEDVQGILEAAQNCLTWIQSNQDDNMSCFDEILSSASRPFLLNGYCGCKVHCGVWKQVMGVCTELIVIWS